MSTPATITVVSAIVPNDLIQPLSDVLAEEEVFATTWEDREGGPGRVEIYLEDATEAEGASETIRQAASRIDLEVAPEIGTIKAEDWAESWKRFFDVMHVSDHLVVRPPWKPYEAKEGEKVLVLDPGMSFGTGRHATTQACMGFLDDLAQENTDRDVLDVGCGSGILSIAACKLGFRSVKGIDNDPDAVRIAAENADVNDADALFQTEDLANCDLSAEVVVANVLAVVLRQFAPAIARCVRKGPGSALILSGILDEQYQDVVTAYEALGFHEIRNILIGEWRSGLLTRS